MVYMQKICYRNLIFHCYGIYVGLCVCVYVFVVKIFMEAILRTSLYMITRF